MKRALVEEVSSNDSLQNRNVLDVVFNESTPNLATLGVIPSKLHLNLLNSDKVDDRIKCLLEIARYLSLLTVEQRKEITDSLIHHLDKEVDNDAKAMLILLIKKCSRFPNVNAHVIVKCLLKELQTNSTKVKWHTYSCIYYILKHRQITNKQNDVLQFLFNSLTSDLSNSHHKVRAISISVLALLPFVFSDQTIMSQSKIQTIISNYARDCDPRVRKSALDALLQMHLRGCPLDLTIYNLSVWCLRDDYEEVRMGGLNLIGVLSALYPEHRMKLAHKDVNETTRLIDDAFNKVCDLVNDSAVAIRTKACVMMASYQHVGSDTLNQTFSKQLMLNLRRKLPRYKQQQKKYANDTIPVAEGDIDVESNEFHLLDSGACGSFIHGLEDEFQEVRNASIDSICELCMYNEQLTKKAVEFLVDMFNDDIDKVRLNAIHSLRKIGTRNTLEFDEEQLEIAVGALEDSDPLARQATHELFTVVRLTVPTSLTILLDALEANMKRYPMDTLSVYQCLRDIGKRHDDYVQDLVPTLLNLDKRYLPKEANVEDIVYTAYVILIVNACSTNVKILYDLPKYIFRHFAYFQSKYPDCIPDLRKLYKIAGIKLEGDIDCLPMTFNPSDSKLVTATEDDITVDMVQLIRAQVKDRELSAALSTIEAAIRNFKTVKPYLSGKAELIQLYLKCFEIIIKAKQGHINGQIEASNLLRYSYTIQYTFLGISKTTLHAAVYFRLVANMIWMFDILKQMPMSKNTSFSIKNMILAFYQRVVLLQKEEFGQNNETINDLKETLLSTSESPTTHKMIKLYSFIIDFLPLEISLDNPVKRTKADITYPLPNPDKPYKFNSKYPASIHIEADIFNSCDTNSFAIEFILPDQSSFMFWPPSGHFKQTTPYCFKLSTNVELSLSSWSESGVVIIRIVQTFEPDLPGLDEYIMNYFGSNFSKSTSSCVISEHLKYHLYPSINARV
ncbi:armadillo-type protein [Cokeromyces recurvatus]|uniref:armadillo-type protein n=1 Tax=Cokeromyces recurvatus TaxID=90255 RepID=UPI002220FF3A|nr:armadillo-type protein [Cokeromyces recurvatus]KAI7897651.1 armadillo-type protein [Cokeromyces recurvatus]